MKETKQNIDLKFNMWNNLEHYDLPKENCHDLSQIPRIAHNVIFLKIFMI